MRHFLVFPPKTNRRTDGQTDRQTDTDRRTDRINEIDEKFGEFLVFFFDLELVN